MVNATSGSYIAARCIGMEEQYVLTNLNVVKLEILLNEIKRMVFTEMDKLWKKKKRKVICVLNK